MPANPSASLERLAICRCGHARDGHMGRLGSGACTSRTQMLPKTSGKWKNCGCEEFQPQLAQIIPDEPHPDTAALSSLRSAVREWRDAEDAWTAAVDALVDCGADEYDRLWAVRDAAQLHWRETKSRLRMLSQEEGT